MRFHLLQLWFRKCHNFLYVWARSQFNLRFWHFGIYRKKSLSASKKNLRLFDWSKMIFLESLLISAVFTDDLRSHWLEEELVEGKTKIIFFTFDGLYWPKSTFFNLVPKFMTFSDLERIVFFNWPQHCHCEL